MIKKFTTWIKDKWVRFKRWILALFGISIALAAGTTFLTETPNPYLNPYPIVSVDGVDMHFPFTDDNANEDVLIFTDKGGYESLSEFTVKAAIVNNSGKPQNVSVQGYFGKSRMRVKEAHEVATSTQSYTVTVDDYAKVCDTGMEHKPCRMVVSGSHEETRVKNDRVSKQLEDPKPKPTNAKESHGTVDKSFKVFIPAGGVAVAEITIEIPDGADIDSAVPEEFFFEAVGEGGGYGHLDPTITFINYATVLDSDGNMSQAVTVPANTDFALAAIGGWNSTDRTVSSISLGGTAMTAVTSVTAGDGDQVNLYRVNTTPGSKTFAATLSGAFAEGGIAILVFLSGVHQTAPVRSSDAKNAIDNATLTFSNMTSQSGDMGVIFVFDYSTSAVDVDLQSQTKIFESSSAYNSDHYGAAYKPATGSTITMAASGYYPGAAAVVLIPEPDAPPASSSSTPAIIWFE